MVTNRKKHIEKTPVKQGAEYIAPEPNKINGPRLMTLTVRI